MCNYYSNIHILGNGVMNYEISDGRVPFARVQLKADESIYAEKRAFLAMSGNGKMSIIKYGDIYKSVKRWFIGERYFFVNIKMTNEPGWVLLSRRRIGGIKGLHLDGGEFLLQKGSFMCADYSINLDVAAVKKPLIGVFGGVGFLMQYISGSGDCLITYEGNMVEHQLGEGESLLLSTTAIVGMDTSVKYEIISTGDVSTMAFSGEGIFLTKLTGPGRVLIQTV
jgi:uncharacterized protein (AIM24 family)